MPPVGFKRSRALWDNARRPHSPKWHAVRPFLRAVLYELQPVRSSQLPAVGRTVRQAVTSVGRALQGVAPLLAQVARFLSQRTRRQWAWTAAAVAYYGAVRWLHAILDAGPILIIVTALVAIFTIGLGDDDDSNSDGLSAYSVFNRGFQRLLGTVDAEDLVAQQMGGGG